MGRIGKFLADSGATGTALLERDQLAHELMFTTRGQPVVYYGDEQGFTGDGGDKDARENMFPSRVPSYNDNRLIGTRATTAESNFDIGHPLYRSIADHIVESERDTVMRFARSLAPSAEAAPPLPPGSAPRAGPCRRA